MTCPLLLARLDDAEARLARVSAETGGHGVEALWLDESARFDPAAVPDAFYVNRGDPYVSTLIYDVRTDQYLTLAWGDWLEMHEAARAADQSQSTMTGGTYD